MIALNQMPAFLSSRAVQQSFGQLYGPDSAQITLQQKRWLKLADLFGRQFPGHPSVRLFSTSGRTEVGGNHTDHQHGRVLCAAVDLDIIAIAAPNQDQVIRLKSEGFPGIDIIDLANLNPVESEREHSASLIRGLAAAFRQRGLKIGGFDAYTTSRVPKGSGLSSSAAFEILVATMLDHLWSGSRVSPVDRAIMAQYAENQYFGKPCGLMDQCGCSVGGFIAIDFCDPAKPAVQPIHLDFAQSGYDLVITDTGGSHADLTDDYASIPRDMKKVAALLGKTVLREVDENIFWAELPGLRQKIDDQPLLRAIHFFQDNGRVALQAEALQKNDITAFLELVRASGNSSRNQLQNVYSVHYPQEQPISLGLSISERILSGRGACRVHGGGFAGTIQAFVPLDLTECYLEAMRRQFGADAPWKLRIRPAGSIELTED
ncbi:MAG: galactokinase family protein [Clostridiaceae bacterium]|nr:galactokinase family protein [Clostridiaceae bacterium]